MLLIVLALGAGLLAYMAKGIVNGLFNSGPKALKTFWTAVGTAVAAVFGDDYGGAVAFVVVLAILIVAVFGLWRRFWEGKPGAAPQGKETYPRVS